MKFDTYRHVDDHAGLRVSAFIENSELALVRSSKDMLREMLTGIVQHLADAYFEDHKAELLASIDIPDILERVQSDIAVRLVTQIVAAMPPVPPTEGA